MIRSMYADKKESMMEITKFLLRIYDKITENKTSDHVSRKII